MRADKSSLIKLDILNAALDSIEYDLEDFKLYDKYEYYNTPRI
jgi:hypothetical protein